MLVLNAEGKLTTDVIFLDTKSDVEHTNIEYNALTVQRHILDLTI